MKKSKTTKKSTTGNKHPKKTHELATRLYVKDGMSIKEIRDELKKRKFELIPDRNTIFNWRKKGNWEKLRKDLSKKALKKNVDLWALDRVKATKRLHKTLNKLLIDYEVGEIKGSVADIERILKLILQLNGINLDQTNIEINNTENKTTISVKAVLMDVAEARKKLDANKPLLENDGR